MYLAAKLLPSIGTEEAPYLIELPGPRLAGLYTYIVLPVCPVNTDVGSKRFLISAIHGIPP